MACREQPQLTATVVHELIGDLLQEVVIDHQNVKLNTKSDTCQRLFDVLGYQACSDSDPEDFTNFLDTDKDDKKQKNNNNNNEQEDQRNNGDNIDVDDSASQCTLYNSPKESKVYYRNWHSWLLDTVTDETSEDEFILYSSKKYNRFMPKLNTVAVQTEQPRLQHKSDPAISNNQGIPQPPPPPAPPTAVPCELIRQTIFIDALNMPLPNGLARPPLADRFCYMLTDFASALYCSLAIMCCCTPNMFR